MKYFVGYEFTGGKSKFWGEMEIIFQPNIFLRSRSDESNRSIKSVIKGH